MLIFCLQLDSEASPGRQSARRSYKLPALVRDHAVNKRDSDGGEEEEENTGEGQDQENERSAGQSSGTLPGSGIYANVSNITKLTSNPAGDNIMEMSSKNEIEGQNNNESQGVSSSSQNQVKLIPTQAEEEECYFSSSSSSSEGNILEAGANICKILYNRSKIVFDRHISMFVDIHEFPMQKSMSIRIQKKCHFFSC